MFNRHANDVVINRQQMWKRVHFAVPDPESPRVRYVDFRSRDSQYGVDNACISLTSSAGVTLNLTFVDLGVVVRAVDPANLPLDKIRAYTRLHP